MFFKSALVNVQSSVDRKCLKINLMLVYLRFCDSCANGCFRKSNFSGKQKYLFLLNYFKLQEPVAQSMGGYCCNNEVGFKSCLKNKIQVIKMGNGLFQATGCRKTDVCRLSQVSMRNSRGSLFREQWDYVFCTPPLVGEYFFIKIAFATC